MYKKALINLTAITLAMSLAFVPAVTTFAAEGDTVVSQDTVVGNTDATVITITTPDGETDVIVRDADDKSYFRAENGVSVVIDGDITSDSKGNSTVYAEDKGSNVVVNGDVTSENFRGVNSQNGTSVTVNGDINSEYKGVVTARGEVVVNGDVNGELAGISITNGGNVTVNGNVTASGYDKTDDNTMGNYDRTEDPEFRDGTRVEGSGIRTDGLGNIYVDGDVIGLNEGILVRPKVNGEGGVIIVEGTLGSINDMSRSERYNGMDLAEDDAKNDFSNTGANLEEIAEKIIAVFPNIYAYRYQEQAFGIAYSVKERIDAGEFTYHDVYEATNSLISDKLNYIIHTGAGETVRFIDGFKTETVNKGTENEKTIIAMAENAVLKVAAAEGYQITGNEAVTITENEDGTYSVKLAKVLGGIEISATLKPVVVKQEVKAQEAAPSYEAQEEVVVEVPFVFATFTVSNAVSADLPEVLGASLEDGASETVVAPKKVVKIAAGNLTAIQYKNAFIDCVKKAPANGVIRLETSRPSCFDRMMLEELAKRPDLTLEVSFPYGGEQVEVAVPEGYDVLSLLDENGYCGFLYLNAVFGANAR